MRMKTIRYSILWALLLAATAQADSVLRDAGDLPLQLAEDAEQSKVYIVQLRGQAAAVRYAKSLGRVASADKQIRFDPTSTAMKAYAERLGAEQDRVLNKAGAGA